jgi:predicted alpha/beta hydrolase
VSIDDPWSTPPSRDAIMAGYRNASVARIDIDPAEHGIASIGHTGYFSGSAVPLWRNALNWLAQH